MNQSDLWVKIQARLVADDGDNKLFDTAGGAPLISGAWNTFAPPEQAYPYIVYQVTNITNRDAFAVDILEVSVQFSVYVDARASVTIAGGTYNGLQVGEAILDRLYGDGVSQSDNIPTYGFHRFKPTLVGPWSGDTFIHRNSNTNHTLETLHFIEEYRIFLSRS